MGGQKVTKVMILAVVEWFDWGAHVVAALKMPLQHLQVWYWCREAKVLKSNKSKSSVHNMTHS